MNQGRDTVAMFCMRVAFCFWISNQCWKGFCVTGGYAMPLINTRRTLNITESWSDHKQKNVSKALGIWEPVTRLSVGFDAKLQHGISTGCKGDSEGCQTLSDTISQKETNPNRTIQEEAELYLEYQIGEAIHTYYLPVVVVSGLVGNSLSILVMMKPHNRLISCCCYMGMLAVSDTAMLLIAAWYWFTATLLDRDIDLWECKILTYMFQVFSVGGIFTILSMTVDRFLVVRFPLKALVWCTPKRAKITLCLVYIFLIIYSLPYIQSTDLLSGTACVAFAKKSSFSEVYSYLSLVLNAWVPFGALLAFNALIIATLRKRRKFLRDYCASSASSSPEVSRRFAIHLREEPALKLHDREHSGDALRGREHQLTAMLLCVTFALLVLTMPQYARYVAYSFIEYKTDAHKYAMYMLAYHVTNKLYYTNNSVNFLLYCLSGSKFRGDLRNLCCGSETCNCTHRKNITSRAELNGSFVIHL